MTLEVRTSCMPSSGCSWKSRRQVTTCGRISLVRVSTEAASGLAAPGGCAAAGAAAVRAASARLRVRLGIRGV